MQKVTFSPHLYNTVACLIVRIPKHWHITPILMSLHWLPILQRIDYKILLMVYKALNGLAPAYISDMLEYKPESKYLLCSDSQSLLVVPKPSTALYGDRDFRNVAPKMWNVLPYDLRICSEETAFKQQLKTHLYREAYGDA